MSGNATADWVQPYTRDDMCRAGLATRSPGLWVFRPPRPARASWLPNVIWICCLLHASKWSVDCIVGGWIRQVGRGRDWYASEWVGRMIRLASQPYRSFPLRRLFYVFVIHLFATQFIVTSLPFCLSSLFVCVFFFTFFFCASIIYFNVTHTQYRHTYRKLHSSHPPLVPLPKLQVADYLPAIPSPPLLSISSVQFDSEWSNTTTSQPPPRPCCCFLFLFCICHNILTETPTPWGGKHHHQYYVVDYILLLTYLLDWVVLFLCIISPFFSCLPKCHHTGSPLPLKRRSVRTGKRS